MILGGIDKSYASGPFVYVPLLEENYYMVKIDDIFVGNQSFAVDNMRGIVDTGTSVLAGNTAWMLKLLSVLPESVSCSDLASYPDIIVTMNGSNFTMKAENYVLEIMGYCMLGVLPMELPESFGNFIILGDVFIRAYYTHFD